MNNLAEHSFSHVCSAYCESCKQIVSTETSKSQLSEELNGVKCEFGSLLVKCTICGQPCFVPEIEELNKEALYDSYRQQRGIISLERLRELPEKYNIGKRPLSILLGWGELTFSRFYDGDIPSKKYSDILIQLFDNPITYRNFLCKNSDRISIAAVQKSLKTVNLIIDDKVHDPVLYSCARYIITQFDEITPLVLQKLLYYINGFYIAFLGESCFVEKCEAWQNGPVYPTIYYLLKEGTLLSIDNLPISIDNPEILPSKLQVITDAVVKSFGCYSGDKLTKFTHEEAPWMRAHDNRIENSIIRNEDLREYFKQVCSTYSIVSVADIRNYSIALISKQI